MPFDNTGNPYDVSQIMSNNTFDINKYKAYSPMYLPTSFFIAYGAQFASLTCVVVHTIRKSLTARSAAPGN